MKKAGILNSDISRVLSYLGHTDTICIGDCGLPIPDEVERIDLALCFGEPTFMRTLEIVAGDMKIEKIVLATEIKIACVSPLICIIFFRLDRLNPNGYKTTVSALDLTGLLMV